MTTIVLRRPRGMTLVELLVVVAILGLFSAVVLPLLDGGPSRATRTAAAAVTGLVARTQAQSIGRENACGLWIEPLSAEAAIDLAIARQPAPYRGDTFDAAVSLSGAAASGTMLLTFSKPEAVTTLTAPLDPPFAADGDFIEFEGAPDRFRLSCPNPPTVDGCRAALRPEAGQTTANTLWPTPTIVGTGTAWHAFSIIRRPRPAAAGVSLGAGLAIDLAWSGVGTQRFGRTTLDGDGASTADPADDLPPLGTYAAGQAVAIMFDRAGMPSELGFFNTAVSLAAGVAPPAEVRTPLRATIFLLVGRIDRCGQAYRQSPPDDASGANWQYADSAWVFVEPKTGLARSMQVVPRDSSGPVTTARRSLAAALSGP